MADAKLSLENMELRIKNLENVQKNLLASGLELKTELKRRWLGGTGADDAAMPSLSKAYAHRKKESGRAGVRNLSYTGEMQAALTLRPVTETSVLLFFSGSENLNKARGNAAKAPGMMDVSDKLGDKIVKNFFERLTGKK